MIHGDHTGQLIPTLQRGETELNDAGPSKVCDIVLIELALYFI